MAVVSYSRNLLLAFSEWLDSQGLHIVPDGDERTHEDLADLYLATRALSPAGDPEEAMQRRVYQAIDRWDAERHNSDSRGSLGRLFRYVQEGFRDQGVN